MYRPRLANLMPMINVLITLIAAVNAIPDAHGGFESLRPEEFLAAEAELQPIPPQINPAKPYETRPVEPLYGDRAEYPVPAILGTPIPQLKPHKSERPAPVLSPSEPIIEPPPNPYEAERPAPVLSPSEPIIEPPPNPYEAERPAPVLLPSEPIIEPPPNPYEAEQPVPVLSPS